MWSRILLFSVASFTASFAADDGWAKVKALASGTELRITKSGARSPILAKMYEATDESLIVATKSEQTSIPKDQIDKIDYRPGPAGQRVVREKTGEYSPSNPNTARPSAGPARPTTPQGSSSSTVNIGSGKGDFQPLWTRNPKH